MTKQASSKRRGMTLRLSTEEAERLEELRKLLGCRGASETIRAAIGISLRTLPPRQESQPSQHLPCRNCGRPNLRYVGTAGKLCHACVRQQT